MGRRATIPADSDIDSMLGPVSESDWLSNREIIQNTTKIVSSYAANNSISAGELPKVIGDVAAALRSIDLDGPSEKPVPAVPINKSVGSDYIICLEDGKKLKMLKRHLRTTYDMSPEEYRAKWGLPQHYPMVAPSYAAARSKLAKKIGLGRKPRRRAR